MATKLKRYRNGMLVIVVVLCLAFAVTAGLIVHRVMRAERAASGLPRVGESSAPVTQEQGRSTSPVAPQTLPGQPQQPPPQEIDSEASNRASHSSTGRISPKDAQDAFTTLTPQEKRREPSPPHLPASSALSAGTDRYPGSEPIEVNANLPDIGVPITTEVYTTTDSLSTVVAYYTRRYSDAEVTEVNGQKIIAIDRPGASKVIAIGTTGEETRISIVKQAN